MKSKSSAFIAFLTIYFAVAATICAILPMLLDKSVELGQYFNGGRPVFQIVKSIKTLGDASWLLPIFNLIIGFYLYKKYHANEFTLKIYIDISLLLLFFYVVIMFFASAYAWLPVRIQQ